MAAVAAATAGMEVAMAAGMAPTLAAIAAALAAVADATPQAFPRGRPMGARGPRTNGGTRPATWPGGPVLAAKTASDTVCTLCLCNVMRIVDLNADL